MFKFAVATLGCKVNQCESAGIAEAMSVRGMTLVPFEEEADCYIINTCTVTGRTDYQSRQLIRRAIRRNPAAAVLVTGCYAQRAPEEIARIPGVRIVAGNAEKARLPELIRGNGRRKGPQVLVGDIRNEKRFSLSGQPLSRTYPRLSEDPGRLQCLLQLLHRPPGAGGKPEPPAGRGRGRDHLPRRETVTARWSSRGSTSAPTVAISFPPLI